MPELPEVETILRSMKPVLEGQHLTEIEINRPDLRVPFPAGLASIPLQQPIEQLRRRAKYMLIDFRHGWTLLLHLGMSGRLFVDAPGQPRPERRHEHLVLHASGGVRIAFVDPRRFGMVGLFPTRDENEQPQLKPLGVEPLSTGFTAEYLLRACARTRTSVKNALLDQKQVAGLGNIYVCEALFQSGIHPARAANSLTREEAERLCRSIAMILQAAIEAGGSTLRDYAHVDGSPGTFQNLHLVYGREGESCPVCLEAGRNTTIGKMTQGGRSTFFCPHCQENRHENHVIRPDVKENA